MVWITEAYKPTHYPLTPPSQIMILSYRSRIHHGRNGQERQREGESRWERSGGWERDKSKQRGEKDRNREILEVIPQGLRKYKKTQKTFLNNNFSSPHHTVSRNTSETPPLCSFLSSTAVCVFQWVCAITTSCVWASDCTWLCLGLRQNGCPPRRKQRVRVKWLDLMWTTNISPYVSCFISNVLYSTWLPR